MNSQIRIQNEIVLHKLKKKTISTNWNQMMHKQPNTQERPRPKLGRNSPHSLIIYFVIDNCIKMTNYFETLMKESQNFPILLRYESYNFASYNSHLQTPIEKLSREKLYPQCCITCSIWKFSETICKYVICKHTLKHKNYLKANQTHVDVCICRLFGFTWCY
jgi:hypothetical protein